MNHTRTNVVGLVTTGENADKFLRLAVRQGRRPTTNHATPGDLRRAYESRLITTGQLAQLLPATWIRSPASMSVENAEHWQVLFAATGYIEATNRNGKWHIGIGENSPPRLYRGCDWERRYGWSWSNDLVTAFCYSQLRPRLPHRGLVPPATVWTTLPPPGALRMTLTNSEGTEFICDPGHLTQIEPVPPDVVTAAIDREKRL